MAHKYTQEEIDLFFEGVRNIKKVLKGSSDFHGFKIDRLLALRTEGIDNKFLKYVPGPGPVDHSEELAAFFECPVCGQTEFRILRSAINCRRFKTPCCDQIVALYIRECPCKDSEGLGCLERPIISTFYIFKGGL